MPPNAIFGVIGPRVFVGNGIVCYLTRCDLPDGRRLFVVTETADETGKHWDQAAEDLASAVLRRYGVGIEPAQAVFFERLPPGDRVEVGGEDFGPFLRWHVLWREEQAVFVTKEPFFERALH